jgi:hypothetical protein
LFGGFHASPFSGAAPGRGDSGTGPEAAPNLHELRMLATIEREAIIGPHERPHK